MEIDGGRYNEVYQRDFCKVILSKSQLDHVIKRMM